jgi:hypothetical protein
MSASVPPRYGSPVPDEPYRAPMQIEPDPYMLAWADLRKRRRVERATLVVGGCVWALVVILKVFGFDFLEVRLGQTGIRLGHLLLVSFAVAAGWVVQTGSPGNSSEREPR